MAQHRCQCFLNRLLSHHLRMSRQISCHVSHCFQFQLASLKSWYPAYCKIISTMVWCNWTGDVCRILTTWDFLQSVLEKCLLMAIWKFTSLSTSCHQSHLTPPKCGTVNGVQNTVYDALSHSKPIHKHYTVSKITISCSLRISVLKVRAFNQNDGPTCTKLEACHKATRKTFQLSRIYTNLVFPSFPEAGYSATNAFGQLYSLAERNWLIFLGLRHETSLKSERQMLETCACRKHKWKYWNKMCRMYKQHMHDTCWSPVCLLM